MQALSVVWSQVAEGRWVGHTETRVTSSTGRSSHLCDSAASPDSKLTSQLCYPLMHFLSPTWMWEELRFCPARLGEPATQLMFSLIWVGWLTPPGWAESMFLSHKMSGKIKTSQEIKYIKGCLNLDYSTVDKIWEFVSSSGDCCSEFKFGTDKNTDRQTETAHFHFLGSAQSHKTKKFNFHF